MNLYGLDGPFEEVESLPILKCPKCMCETWIIKGAFHDHGVMGIYCQDCGRWLKWLGKFK